MKKYLCLLLALVMLFGLCACGEGEATNGGSVTTQTLPQIFDAEQYQIYQNLFFNGQKDSFIGQQMTVTGVFVAIRDSFNSVTRYYCWGYYDQTKCCDWQWELKLDSNTDLPANGSKVTFSGTFAEDEKALDGVWMTDVSLTVEETYVGETCDYDLCLMNATLERVQLMNMQYFPDEYEGKSIRLYGRVYDPGTLQHPYYDGAWMQPFESAEPVTALGLTVIVKGTFSGGTITNAAVNETTDY